MPQDSSPESCYTCAFAATDGCDCPARHACIAATKNLTTASQHPILVMLFNTIELARSHGLSDAQFFAIVCEIMERPSSNYEDYAA